MVRRRARKREERTIVQRGQIYVITRQFGIRYYGLPRQTARGRFGKIHWWGPAERRAIVALRKRAVSITPTVAVSTSSLPPSSLETTWKGVDRSARAHPYHTDLVYDCNACLLRSSIKTLWRRGEIEGPTPVAPFTPLSLLNTARREVRGILAEVDRKLVVNVIRSLPLSEEMIRTVVHDQRSLV